MRIVLARARFWYGLSDNGVEIGALLRVLLLFESIGIVFREVGEGQKVIFPDSRGFLFFLSELNLVNVGIFVDIELDDVIEILSVLVFAEQIQFDFIVRRSRHDFERFDDLIDEKLFLPW